MSEQIFELMVIGDDNDGEYVYAFSHVSIKIMKQVYPVFKRIIEMQDKNNQVNLEDIISILAYEDHPDDEGMIDHFCDFFREFMPHSDWVMCNTLTGFRLLPMDVGIVEYDTYSHDTIQLKRGSWVAQNIAEEDWLESIKRPIREGADHRRRTARDYMGGDGDYYWADENFMYCRVHQAEDRPMFTHIVYSGK